MTNRIDLDNAGPRRGGNIDGFGATWRCNLCAVDNTSMWTLSLQLPNGLYLDYLCDSCYEAVLISSQMTAMNIIMQNGGLDRLAQDRYNL